MGEPGNRAVASFNGQRSEEKPIRCVCWILYVAAHVALSRGSVLTASVASIHDR